MNIKPMRRAIVIENEPDFAALLETMLSTLDYDVIISTEARLSYAASLSDRDLVFLDIQKRRFSGRQVLEQLAHQKSKSPLFLMSRHFENLEEAETLAHKLALNLIAALEKPFGLEDLQDVLPGPTMFNLHESK